MNATSVEKNFDYGTSTSDQTQDGISCSALRTTADRFGTYFETRCIFFYHWWFENMFYTFQLIAPVRLTTEIILSLVHFSGVVFLDLGSFVGHQKAEDT